ncbi:PWWP domain-containing protein [Fusarium heterosporum]|uniref:PWWP domain-containing protein n=1 Tax=Fusarium heterosporum TaxID=42747 RepID=A0A8H5TT29_FUSHE|nr:PWWP domain-containing protein [Fusarium heterosporum]
MADQVTEKHEVEAPAPDVQGAPATERPAEPSSTGDDAAKTEGEASKEDTKVAQGDVLEIAPQFLAYSVTQARPSLCQTHADHFAPPETKEGGNTEKPTEDKDATESSKDNSKPADDTIDTEMRDATDPPAAEDTKVDNSAPSADGETAAENAATETPSAKGKNNRRKSTGGANRKSLSKKASKARLTHSDAKPGDHFLVKLKGFPAWPAIVCDETMLPQALVDNRPVAAARPDGSYTEAYADGGKRANDRTFPVMYLHTNEFGWVPNAQLTELPPQKAQDSITEKMRKDLKEAFTLAAESNSIDHYKEVLKQFQDEFIAKQQAALTPKKSKKGKAKAADEDVDMEDIDDVTAEKPKAKKRKAEDEASRPDSVKKPKIKLNTSTPKANGTPKTKEESAAKTKVKVKKSTDKKTEGAKKAKMTPEERRHHKEKEVLYLRHKLQRGLLTRDQQPQEPEMEQMSEYVTMLEKLKDLEVSIIRATKINKVLKAILKLESIPREDEFNFKDRSQVLLDKWNKLLATETAAPAGETTNGVNGKSDAKADDKKDDSGKENTEEPKSETSKTEESKAEKTEEDEKTEEEEKILETPQASAPEEKKDDAVAPSEPVEAAA